MQLSKYTKAISALVTGLVIALPALNAANNDGTVSLQEWMTILGLFVPAIVVALSPANKLDTGDLVNQINRNPDIDLVAKATPR
jgi:hypothetical protein